MAILAVLAGAPQATAGAATVEVLASSAATDTPRVQIGLFAYGPDGTERGYVTTGPDPGQTKISSNSAVYSGPGCVMGAGTVGANVDRADQAWRISGQVVEEGAQQAIVELMLQRIMRDGKAVTESPASQRIVLNLGTPVVLEQLPQELNGACAARRIVLEARFAVRALPPGAVRAGSGGGFGSGGGASAGGGSGGAGGVVSTSGGVTVSRGGGAGGSTSVSVNRGSGGTAASSAGQTGPTYDVDLWLVRARSTGEPDEVVHSVLRIDRAGGSAQFAPVTLTSPQGAATVSIGARVAVQPGTSGEPQLAFTTTRSVQFVPVGRPPRDAVTSTGTTTGPLPGATETLSFEMPAISLPGGPTFDDKFSIRLKVRPRN